MDLLPRMRLEMPCAGFYQGMVLRLIEECARAGGVDGVSSERLTRCANIALGLIIDRNEGTVAEGQIILEIRLLPSTLRVEIANHGVPVFPQGQTDHGVSIQKLLELDDLAKDFVTLEFENFGRDGQRVTFEVKHSETLALPQYVAPTRGQVTTSGQEQIQFTEFPAGKEAALSRLFHRVYGYNYVNDFVYYPERIRALHEQGRLVSCVAAFGDGTLVGHVGLLKWRDNPAVWEPCLAVSDPAVKSRGLFSQLFGQIMERVKQIPMQYCFSDTVTNHEFSQRLIARYNACDIAIFVGSQISETQAKLEKLGIGIDAEEMDRYSLLYSVFPQVRHPFGESVSLPNSIGDPLGFLLEQFNMRWVPTPRFSQPEEEGEFSVTTQSAQAAIVYDLKRPGFKAAKTILADWHEQMRNGYEYAGVDIPIDAPGLGVLHDMFAGAGFFLGGFVPHDFSDKLAVRFQALGPRKVAFDDIKIFSPLGKRLLSVIREDYERNKII